MDMIWLIWICVLGVKLLGLLVWHQMEEKGNIEPSMAERTALLKQQSKKIHC